jgi:curved DNA-binding protein CbpA
VENPKTFRIDRGIGQYDFNDYYAVLGLPLTAEASHVRRRYLLIAKCLHPDIHGRTSIEKQVATQYLSKMVNPAYNVLSQERERTEYSAILKLLGKRLMKRNQKFAPQSDIAKNYLTSSKDINYEQAIQEIAKVQYQDLEQALENISLLSELNLVHILLQEGYKPSLNEFGNSGIISPRSSSAIASPNTNSSTANPIYSNNTNSSYQMRSESKVQPRNANNTTNTTNPVANGSTNSASQSNNINQSANSNSNSTNIGNNIASGSINHHIRQAEIYVNQQLWASALKELRSAIQIDCTNSKCHALLGFVYMNQKLAGMAKVSFQQALKLNPNEPIAIKYISQVGGLLSNTDKSQSDSQSKSQSNLKDNKKSGFFGWLGGG